MPEPLSYLYRPISLAALSVIELTPPEMVTAVSLAGHRYISLRLLRRTRSSVEGTICCPNSGDASSAPLL